MSFWQGLFGPRVNMDALNRTLEHQRDLDRLESENRVLRESAAFQREMGRLNVQTSAPCPGCAGLREAIEVLKGEIRRQEEVIQARDKTLQQFHGAGFDRAMAEHEVFRAERRAAVREFEPEPGNKDEAATETEERGAHAGRIDFDGTAPQALPDDVLEKF